jgi:hypothetical protein
MPVNITAELRLDTVPGGTWKLVNNNGVGFEVYESDVRINHRVKRGFRTDLNSGHYLPEAWHHRSRHAALLHDDLYKQGLLTRKQSDKAFYYVLRARGAKFWRARIMYAGVRAGGWLAWRKHRAKENQAKN